MTSSRTDANKAGAAQGRRSLKSDAVQERLNELIREAGGDPEDGDSRFIREIMLTGLKLVGDRRDRGEIKLVSSSIKEMRHAFRVFAGYPHVHKVSIFGSARTPHDHPDYIAALEFSRMMAHRGWAVITGAGDGIMRAGHEGPGREASFGLAIRLPFETTANTVIAGDPKLVTFRYFFTRKLIFVSQAEAVAIFPGGFGTHDEAFEVLTLIQTGKTSMVPVVLIEGVDGQYWRHWKQYLDEFLLEGGFISPEDVELFHVARDPADAVEHIVSFYRNYHSSRYVRDDLVIRVRRLLRPEDVERLNDEFGVLVREGRIEQQGALPEEDDHLDLPRIVFTHTRRQYGLVRKMIDRINEFQPADRPA